MVDKIQLDREQVAEYWIMKSGKIVHSNCCATSIAPAEEPGPCDCDEVQTLPAPVEEGQIPCEWYGRDLGKHSWIDLPQFRIQRCEKCKQERVLSSPSELIEQRAKQEAAGEVKKAQRYEYSTVNYAFNSHHVMKKDDDGDYVLFEDYDAALRELQRLQEYVKDDPSKHLLNRLHAAECLLLDKESEIQQLKEKLQK